jgi:hypothetical protein
MSVGLSVVSGTAKSAALDYFALSTDGHNLAVLTGITISVYRLPEASCDASSCDLLKQWIFRTALSTARTTVEKSRLRS